MFKSIEGENSAGVVAVKPQKSHIGSSRLWGPVLSLMLLSTACGPAEPARSIATVVAGFQDTPYGKPAIINKDNNELITVDQFQAARVQFIAPVRDYETQETRGKITIRREPSLERPEEAILWPSQIKTDHIVRVLGRSYSDISALGERTIVYKGQEFPVGLWGILANENSKFVSPDGAELR